eukprot:2596543-Amphidinium_carterae.2
MFRTCQSEDMCGPQPRAMTMGGEVEGMPLPSTEVAKDRPLACLTAVLPIVDQRSILRCWH